MSTLLPVDMRAVTRSLVFDPPMTDAEFEALCRANDNVQFERTQEGVIHMNPPAGALSGDGNAEIIWQLRNWWSIHENGRVFDSNTGFHLPDDSILSPDAAYATPESLKGLSKADLISFPHLCPDFVIELLSETDRLAKAQKKMQDWIRNGAKLAWLIDPYAKKVHVYRPEMKTTIVTSATLVGAGPVEGFTLDLARVWRRFEL